MSKSGKNLIATVIAAFTILSLLAGCGNTEQKPAASGTASAASGTAPAASQAKEEQKPGLRVLNIWQKDDYNTYPVAKVIEDKTGYHVDYEMLPQDKPQDKLNLLMASGEPYDLITIDGGLPENQTLYYNYAQKGALVEITPLMEKYGPNLKASVSQHSFDGMKVDGKVYAIPIISDGAANISLLVRQDWLDKLNIKMPATVDEFVDMLKAFKEKDPGGNGKDKNMPLTIDGSVPLVNNLEGAFGIPNAWNDVGGKLTPQVFDPAFKDYLTFMTDLYKQGLLDKEFPTNKVATIWEKFTSGRAGVIPAAWWDVPTILDTLKKNNPDAKTAYIPALKGKDGKMGLSVVPGYGRISFIPKASKHPEDTMKWINAKLDKDTFKLIVIGEEGKHYTYKDGAYTPILPIFTEERGQANNYMTGIDEKNYPAYWQARVRKDPRLFATFNFLNNEQPPETRKVDVLGYSFNLQAYSQNSQKLSTMVNDYMVTVIAGGESITGFDAFVQKYKEAGGDASYKDVNDWYATYKK